MTAAQALIIEDDGNLATIFCQAIQRAGFEAIAATTGEEALRLLFDQPEPLRPALIVLDFHLPGISGVDVLHRIRSAPELKEAILILATADPLLGDIYSDQADYLLLKPVSYHQLRDLARTLAPTPPA